MVRYNNPAKQAVVSGVSRTALMGADVALVRAIQGAQGTEQCFRTEKRLICGDYTCEWRGECCRLVAVWRR